MTTPTVHPGPSFIRAARPGDHDRQAGGAGRPLSAVRASVCQSTVDRRPWTKGTIPWLTVLGAGTVGCWWRIRALGDPRLHLSAFYGWFTAAFALYLVTVWLVRRTEQAARPRVAFVSGLGLVFAVSVLARIVLLDTTPTLSDDIYRYRWDGRVQRAGFDPYAYPPNNLTLAFLRDAQFPRINFPQLRAVYPPLTELAFRLGTRLGDSLTAQKVVFVLAELVTVASLLFILWRRGQSLLWMAAYAWHPLVILEIAGSGHNDSLGVAALWLGLAAWEARLWSGCAFAWVAAFLAKFFSIVLTPWWWYRRTSRGWLAVFALLAVSSLAWHRSLVCAVVESFSAMASKGSSNASLYLAISAGVSHAKVAPLVALGMCTAFLLWWAKREIDPIRYLCGVVAAAALLSPVLHPWYLLWLIPCFCFWRAPALVALTGTVVLAYTVWPGRLADGRWTLPVWAHVLEYAPVALLGLWALRRAIREWPSGQVAKWRRSQRSDSQMATAFCSHFATSPPSHLATPLRVALIIPARNEAEALGRVLAEIPRHLVHEIIVVDNGSTDKTAEVVVRSGARLAREPRPGYGRACLAGITVLDPSVDTVAFMDADHSDDPEDLVRVLAPIAQGRADLVIGSRVFLAEPGSLAVQQRFGNRLACWLMRWLFGARYTDLGPFRAIRRRSLEQLQMEDQAFGWTVEMQAKAAIHRLRVVEVPVRYRRRIGRSKISGTISGTIRAGVAIISTILKIACSWRLEAGGWRLVRLPTALSLRPSAKRLLIFLKYPTPGQVKTRLAEAVGSQASCEIARAIAELTLERMRVLRDETIVCVDPPGALELARAWLGPRWHLRPQRGAHLGERLAEATSHTFAEGAGKVVVIGSDSPWLTAVDVEAAFAELDRADVVIGPAEDGGYYLIGLSRETPGLFVGVAWGSSAVYAQTLANANALGWRVSRLKPGYDVDRLDDVRRFLSEERARGAVPDAVEVIASASGNGSSGIGITGEEDHA